MANRQVTLTGTTVGTSITTVSIYHTSVNVNNLIASGVTRSELISGYVFNDDETHTTYYIVAEGGTCSTQTSVEIGGVTPTPTSTSTPTVTPTNTSTPSNTPTNTVTPTVTPTNTSTPTITPTNTSTPSNTPTNTVTPTVTPTNTATPTVTPTNTSTPTVTPTNTVTPSITPSNTSSPTPTPTPTPTQTVSPSGVSGGSSNNAYVFISTDSDYQNNTGDLLDHMFINSSGTWVGFNSGAAGFNNDDAQVWMDWPGFTGGTSNGSQVLTTTVDQASYLFNSVTLSQNSFTGTTGHVAIVIPVSSMDNDTYRLTIIDYDYNNDGSFDTTLPNAIVSGVLVTYSGGYWPSGNYRVYHAGALASNTNGSYPYVWRGNSKTP